jgi:hypothetical protein
MEYYSLDGGSVMKGAVVAGGTDYRVSPPAAVTDKRPRQVGITDIFVETEREHTGDVLEIPGSGHHFGLEFTYRRGAHDFKRLGVTELSNNGRRARCT